MTRAFIALALVLIGIAGATASAIFVWSPAAGAFVGCTGLVLLGILSGLSD